MRKIIFLITGIVILGAIGYGIAVKIHDSSQKTKSKRTRVKPGTGIAIPVETVAVKFRNIRNIRTFTGTLEPWSKYEVAPKIAGRLENLNVEVGDPVYNGQLLATIDDDEYLQEIEKAKADLGISEAAKSELMTHLNLAKLEYERARSMKKSKVISDSAYESKRSDFLVKLASLKKTQAELNQKAAILKLAKVRYDYTKIYARWGRKNFFFSVKSSEKNENTVKNIFTKLLFTPANIKKYKFSSIHIEKKSPGNFIIELELTNPVFDYANLESKIIDAVNSLSTQLPLNTTIKYQPRTSVRYIGKKYLDAGQMLKANDAILSIVNITRMKAMVNVIEKDYPLLKSGQNAFVTTDAYPDKTFVGKVRKITKVLDEYTRQAQVEIEIDNSKLLLRPGMFVKVSIEFATVKNAQTVPRIAVVNFNDVTGVFMLSSDRKTVQFIPVKTGLIDGGTIQIVSPRLIHPVVTLGNHLLYSGVAVKITSRGKVLNEILSGKDKKDKKDKNGKDTPRGSRNKKQSSGHAAQNPAEAKK
jgi:multidrug efflux pump subunit AcrA (membrane-fusion protein)